jgi:hypothetical protein
MSPPFSARTKKNTLKNSGSLPRTQLGSLAYELSILVTARVPPLGLSRSRGRKKTTTGWRSFASTAHSTHSPHSSAPNAVRRSQDEICWGGQEQSALRPAGVYLLRLPLLLLLVPGRQPLPLVSWTRGAPLLSLFPFYPACRVNAFWSLG